MSDDEMRPEYDFSGATRGRHAHRAKCANVGCERDAVMSVVWFNGVLENTALMCKPCGKRRLLDGLRNGLAIRFGQIEKPPNG